MEVTLSTHDAGGLHRARPEARRGHGPHPPSKPRSSIARALTLRSRIDSRGWPLSGRARAALGGLAEQPRPVRGLLLARDGTRPRGRPLRAGEGRGIGGAGCHGGRGRIEPFQLAAVDGARRLQVGLMRPFVARHAHRLAACRRGLCRRGRLHLGVGAMALQLRLRPRLRPALAALHQRLAILEGGGEGGTRRQPGQVDPLTSMSPPGLGSRRAAPLLLTVAAHLSASRAKPLRAVELADGEIEAVAHAQTRTRWGRCRCDRGAGPRRRPSWVDRGRHRAGGRVTAAPASRSRISIAGSSAPGPAAPATPADPRAPQLARTTPSQFHPGTAGRRAAGRNARIMEPVMRADLPILSEW